MADFDKADVEETVIAWLNSIVGDGWAASGNKPTNAPEQYITVDRAGGPRIAMVLDAAQILIEVYHKTSRTIAKSKALEIADRIVELKQYDEITIAEVNSVVHLQDTLAQYERYQVYCDVAGRR